ncbi:GntR family transcriptional regulator [Amycolatopsis decaplanina DSM 44594]|uniref:GntR family transcriptional regulator n=1 Tax=Amycolatopsis decaplanina DSM 44594 TaxID=1284240 RepID=M2YBJ1_9PSEU|nr:hypothetical protein [Amycolatopsis decaplanina]EME52222.1 GntR family transcriptional regulator [Amycolatopsis decaplanina DSM 44594]
MFSARAWAKRLPLLADLRLETFDRMWTASELARDADAAAEALTRHLTLTAAALAEEP